MKKNQILTAWRDEEYFLSLTDEERAQIPEHPAGVLAVEDDLLRTITGGCGPYKTLSGAGCGPTSAYCTPCTPYACTDEPPAPPE
jgi:mersacidin/lichenicidin family type 2 lantibiotic